ncbi:unnamed protein product, partial [Amoebophrya sp. A25]
VVEKQEVPRKSISIADLGTSKNDAGLAADAGTSVVVLGSMLLQNNTVEQTTLNGDQLHTLENAAESVSNEVKVSDIERRSLSKFDELQSQEKVVAEKLQLLQPQAQATAVENRVVSSSEVPSESRPSKSSSPAPEPSSSSISLSTSTRASTSIRQLQQVE